MKTLLGVYFISRSFSLDEFTLLSGGTNIRTLLTPKSIFIWKTSNKKNTA